MFSSLRCVPLLCSRLSSLAPRHNSHALTSHMAVVGLLPKRGWDGNVNSLPSLSSSVCEGFQSPQVLECRECRVKKQLVRVRLPTHVRGGRRWRKKVTSPEFLFVEMDAAFECALRFAWLRSSTKAFRAARLQRRGDNMENLCINVATVSRNGRAKRKRLCLFNLLGWTFRLPLTMTEPAWSTSHVIDHVDDDHTNTVTSNLQVLAKADHDRKSGRKGGEETQRRRREFLEAMDVLEASCSDSLSTHSP